MIIVFFGESGTGKTTLCKNFFSYLKNIYPFKIHYIDESKLAKIFGEDESSEYIPELAIYERSLNDIVLISANLLDADERLRMNNFALRTASKKVIWVNLHKGTPIPFNENGIHINVNENSEKESLDIFINYYQKCVKKH